MAIDPIGGSPELDVPGIRAPAPLTQQAPTGFSGPTPAPVDRQYGAPIDGPAMPAPTTSLPAGPTQIGWSAEQMDMLENAFRINDPSLLNDTQRLNEMAGMVMRNSDPSILQESSSQFNRQVAMSTQQVFEERTMLRMLGFVSDQEAFTAATSDLWLDTYGNVQSAGQVFADSDIQKTWYTEAFLTGRDRFREIEADVSARALSVWRDKYEISPDAGRVGGWGAIGAQDMVGEARGALEELGGKGFMFLQDGANLALRFSDGESEWDVLVRLDPDESIETPADAIAAYALAVAGAEGVIDPSSDEVPGRQGLLGTIWEKSDNVIAAFERWGSNGTIPSLNQQLASIDRAMLGGRRNPTIDGVDQDAESIRSQIEDAHPEKATRDALLVSIARSSAVDDGAPMSQVVMAGVSGLDLMGDTGVAEVHAATIDDLVKAAQEDREQLSNLGRFIDEDIAPPVLSALTTWEAALQFAGVTALHFTTSDEIADLARRVGDEGLGALFDTENLGLLPVVDYGQIVEDVREVTEVGLPAFTAGYVEANVGRTVADEYNIDPESNLAMWVNIGASVAIDPITWLTLGGASSWKALERSLTTTAGAQKYVQSPVIKSMLKHIVVKSDTDMFALITAGMDSPAALRLNRILQTTYETRPERAAAMLEAQNVILHQLPAYGGRWLPAGPGRALTRKTALGLGRYFARLGQKGFVGEKYWKLAQDVLARAPRQRAATINPRDFVSEQANLMAIRFGDDVGRFSSHYEDMIGVYDTYAAGDAAGAMIEGQVIGVRKELEALAAGLIDDSSGRGVNFVNWLRKSVNEMDDAVKALDEQIARRTTAAGRATDYVGEVPQRLAAAIDELTRLKALPKSDDVVEAIKTTEKEIDFLTRTAADVADDTTVGTLRAARERAAVVRAETQSMLDEAAPVFNDIHSAIRDRQRLLDRYMKQLSLLDSGVENRGVLEQWVHRFYDEWADEINAAFVEKGWATADDVAVKARAGVGGTVEVSDDATRKAVISNAEAIIKRQGLKPTRSIVLPDGKRVNIIDLGTDSVVAVADDGTVMGAVIGSSFGTASQYGRNGIGTALIREAAERRGATTAREFADTLTGSISKEGAAAINRAFNIGPLTGSNLPIPIVPGKTNSLFPDIPARDWSRISGRDGAAAYESRVVNAGNLEPFGVEAASAREIGMGAVAGNTPLPASPYELLAFSHTKPSVWTFLHETSMGAGFTNTMNTMQMVWASSVLLNPRTSLRSSLDEVIRFYEDTGASTDVLKTVGGSVPGTGKLHPAHSSGGRAFVRDQANSFVPRGTAGWEMVDPSKPGKWVSAERWVNGTLMNDPQFKAFARAVANSTDEDMARILWEEWWNESGAALARRSTFSSTSTRAGQSINAVNSYNVIRDSLDTWLAGISDDSLRASTRSKMIDAAASSAQVDEAARFWRQMPLVPGESSQANRAVEGAFSLFYGAPQARRGGVFYDHYQDYAYQTYRNANQGKIIDAEWLVEQGHVASRSEADKLIAAGTRNSQLREIINKTGYVLDEDLRQSAMQWAATQADNMMYTFGAGSILGKKMARVYPFGRAQVDYLQWWWKKLTQPTQFGVSGGAAHVVNTGVNLRLADRMAHLFSLGEPQEQGSYERPSALSPAGVVNNFTFLPTAFDSQFLMETLPSLGPMATWMLNLPQVPDSVRTAIQELHPAHAIFTEPYESVGDVWQGFVDTMIPKSGLSLWNLGDTALNAGFLAAAYMTVGADPYDNLTSDQEREINHVTSSMMWAAEGPFERDQQSFLLADWLGDNGFDTFPDLQNPAWFAINDQAVVNALRENLADTASKIGGAAVQSGSDFRYVDVLLPAVDYASGWLDAGYISQAKYDSIVIGHAVISGDDGTPKDRRMYADDVLDALFVMIPREERTRFIAENPEAAINFVSWYRIEPTLVPEDARAGVDGTRIIATGQERTDLLRRGIDEGWVVPKDPNEHHYEAHLAVHRAARDRLSDIYEESVGEPIGKRTKELLESTITLSPLWWDNYGEWLSEVDVGIPRLLRSSLIAGGEYSMTIGEFRTMMKDAKDRFAYKFTDDSIHEAKLRKLGTDDSPPSRISHQLSNLEGFDTVDFDKARPLAYYGKGLLDDLDGAVRAIESEFGWSNPSEWEVESSERIQTVAANGDITTWPSADEFRSRFRTAIALSSLSPSDAMQFSERDYLSSQWARWFGDINYEPPAPPPLTEVEAYHTTTSDRVNIIDGDTVKIMGDDGPAYLRLLGVNAPEQGEPGYGRASLDLDKLLAGQEVSFVIWQPERYGRTQSFFTEDSAGMVQYRDRTFVWLYVNGVPIYDPDVFSETNIRGVGTGGEVPDYRAMYVRGRSEQ